MRPSRPGISFGSKQAPLSEDQALLKTIKTYCNTLKCPVCSGQLDGLVRLDEQFGLMCVYDVNEYYMTINVVSNVPVVVSESVRIHCGKFQYLIKQTPRNTIITPQYVDSEGMVIVNNPKLVTPPPISFQQKIFNFQNLNREKLANKIKVLLVLQ